MDHSSSPVSTSIVRTPPRRPVTMVHRSAWSSLMRHTSSSEPAGRRYRVAGLSSRTLSVRGSAMAVLRPQCRSKRHRRRHSS